MTSYMHGEALPPCLSKMLHTCVHMLSLALLYPYKVLSAFRYCADSLQKRDGQFRHPKQNSMTIMMLFSASHDAELAHEMSLATGTSEWS